jgi:7,8-dihydropterin-6-yl-methyl-4-(beta-D-ribofuranosyl)aminobenzene 5'-phosphate synthase
MAEGESMTHAEAAERVRITVVADNNGPVPDGVHPISRLGTAWGFACVVETGDERILFDTGSDGTMLIANMDALGIDPTAIDTLVISHEHWDHVGGVDALLNAGARPVAYVPRSFTDEFRERLAARVTVVEVTGQSAVGERARTTGELGTSIVEQALVVPSAEGLVVVTGCAHPGIAHIVRSAAAGDRVALVVGGFHLKDADTREIAEAVEELRGLGVARVAPTHCTGDAARARFALEFGDDCIPVGVGTVIEVGG